MSTLTVRPASSGDDGYVYGDIYNNTGVGLLIGNVGESVGSFVRFPNVTIPQASTINSAFLVYTAYYSIPLVPVNTEIYINDVDDAVAPTTINEYNSLSLWGVNGNPVAVMWSSIGAWVADGEYTSPDIKELVQGVVDRVGWDSGNALLIKHTDDTTSDDSCYRGPYAYDGSSTKCPRLVIDYTVADTPIIGETYPLPPFKRS